MIITGISRRFLIVTAYIFGGILVLLTAFHFWFINHAEGLIEDMVEARSNGKIRLDVKKFKFNWFSYDMELRDAVFYSPDSADASTSYRFSVRSMHITVREIIPLVFEKKILIDSLRLLDPDIRVTRLRATRNDSINSPSVSLPQEVGRVYNSIQDALEVLKVNRFHIDNGRFTLVNKIQPDQLPVSITNIDFHLVNLVVDSSKRADSQILFSDNVALHTFDQDILFPDGRHRLQFRNFNINILNKMVEFDSCTLTAIKDDSSRSSFTIFFDKLLLTNIDFDTLYRKEVIKADSVYCINPRFRLDVELEKKTGPRKPPPTLNELIQQLTGDLQLEFVVVQNGSFDINTIRDGKPSSFTSTNNNFEMQGLRIREKAARPLTVRSFSMAIRNYENFLGDSTYSMQFDSIHLINNSIFLSNFALRQMSRGDTINTFRMPRFELRGLSWDDLVFEQRLSATNATLYRPVIDYTIPPNNHGNRHDVFQALAGIGKIIQLDHLDISDGQVNVFFNGGSGLQLQNAYVSLLGHDLARSGHYLDLQQAVRRLRFRKGVLRLNGLTTRMENVAFTGSTGAMTAGIASISNDGGDLDIEARDVAVNRLIVDNASGFSEIDGLRWKQARINIDATRGNAGPGSGYLLRNVNGTDTRLTYTGKEYSVNTFLASISFDRFAPGINHPAFVENLSTSGRDLDFKGAGLGIRVEKFHLEDKEDSRLTGLQFSYHTTSDSIEATVPAVNFNPDLNAMIAGKLIAERLELEGPVINILKGSQGGDDYRAPLPHIDIGSLKLSSPDLRLSFPGNRVSMAQWHAAGGSKDFLSITRLKVDSLHGFQASDIGFLVNDFELRFLGRNFSTGRGNINGLLEKISIRQDSGTWKWEGRVKELGVADLAFDSLGRKNGKISISSAKLNDLDIRWNLFSDIQRLVRENAAFRLGNISGTYENKEVYFLWKNVSFDKYNRTFSLDSFSISPVPSRDSFMAATAWQTDYMKFRTGAVVAGPFDLDRYLADTVVQAGRIEINNAFLSSFRDKRKPFQGGKIKHLPAGALKRLPVKISVDSLVVRQSTVEYMELNEKTGRTGRVEIKDLEATLSPAVNIGYHNNDSLDIKLSATMNDAVKFDIAMRESFTDSLHGFLLTASVHPFDAQLLNPLVGPLASVAIRSGYLDSLFMRVAGNEYQATGEMKMFYHGLRVNFLDSKGEERKGLFRGLKNFFTNTFVIKNANRDHISPIFLERNREKSAVNYLVKITLSGLGHTIGIRNNKKLLRQYKKDPRKRNLPPVHYDLKQGR